jgi:hypothetical protein
MIHVCLGKLYALHALMKKIATVETTHCATASKDDPEKCNKISEFCQYSSEWGKCLSKLETSHLVYIHETPLEASLIKNPVFRYKMKWRRININC